MNTASSARWPCNWVVDAVAIAGWNNQSIKPSSGKKSCGKKFINCRQLFAPLQKLKNQAESKKRTPCYISLHAIFAAGAVEVFVYLQFACWNVTVRICCPLFLARNLQSFPSAIYYAHQLQSKHRAGCISVGAATAAGKPNQNIVAHLKVNSFQNSK